MNIFKILSSYDGRVSEPSVTALLNYYLDENEDHGLSDTLLRAIADDFDIPKDYQDVLVDSEKRFTDKYGNNRDIDIVIEFRDDKGKTKYVLAIENKIKDSSIQGKNKENKNQLEDEWKGLLDYYKEIHKKIYFCFLTLTKSTKSDNEFTKFTNNNKDYIKNMRHLYWKQQENEASCENETDSNEKKITSIEEKLTKLLEQESRCERDPLTYEAKFLIKSFISFIQTDFTSEYSEKKERAIYGKPVVDYYRDYVKNEWKKDEAIEIETIKKWVIDKIEAMKVIPNEGTVDLQLKKLIVNAPTRKNIGVTAKNQDKYNLFYYCCDDKEKIMKLPDNPAARAKIIEDKKITVYFSK